jgi:DNA-binding MarR family transcriptional regulator
MQSNRKTTQQRAAEQPPDTAPASRRNWAPPGTGLGNLLREAELAFSKVFRKELAAYGVSVAQYQHLRRLWEADGITQAELSRSIGVENASSTATLDALERQGLIRRVRNSADRRKINVFLTPPGAALQDVLIACARRTNAIATRGISRKRIDEVFALVRAMTDNLRAADRNSDDS